MTSGAEYVRLTTGIRRFFYVASFLVLAVGTILFLGSTHTARYFEWTIKSPLTAASRRELLGRGRARAARRPAAGVGASTFTAAPS